MTLPKNSKCQHKKVNSEKMELFKWKWRGFFARVDGRVMYLKYLIEEKKTWHVWMSLLSMPWSTTIAIVVALYYEKAPLTTHFHLQWWKTTKGTTTTKHIHVHAHHERRKLSMAGPEKRVKWHPFHRKCKKHLSKECSFLSSHLLSLKTWVEKVFSPG